MTLQITSDWIPSDLPDIQVRVQITPTDGGFLRLRCHSRCKGVERLIVNPVYCRSMRGIRRSIKRSLADHLTLGHRLSLLKSIEEFAGSDRNWRKEA